MSNESTSGIPNKERGILRTPVILKKEKIRKIYFSSFGGDSPSDGRVLMRYTMAPTTTIMSRTAGITISMGIPDEPGGGVVSAGEGVVGDVSGPAFRHKA
jgi:hypothetical protein